MSKLTLVLDDINNTELKDYLISLEGINNVSISNNDYLEINITYDESKITDNIIMMEIYTFLNINKLPSLIKFDKHFNGKTNTYKIESNICCEYCFKIAIEELYDIVGIKKVDSNYISQYINRDLTKKEKDTLIINYDPKVINLDEMMEIEKKLDI